MARNVIRESYISPPLRGGKQGLRSRDFCMVWGDTLVFMVEILLVLVRKFGSLKKCMVILWKWRKEFKKPFRKVEYDFDS